MPEHRTGTFSGHDGLALFTQSWQVAQPHADVALIHGYAEHSGRYSHVAAALNEGGYNVWSYDLRGHGRSPGNRATIKRFDELNADVTAFMRQLRDKVSGRPVFLMGHSMGGLLSANYAYENQQNLAGLILSSPAFRVEEHVPKILLALSGVASAMAPNLPTTPFDVTTVSRDPAVQQAYLNDPLNYNGAVKSRMGRELLLASRRGLERAALLRLPVLVLVGEQDMLVNPSGTFAAFDRFGSTDKTLHRYPEARHEVLNEPEQHEILPLIRAWLDSRVLEAVQKEPASA